MRRTPSLRELRDRRRCRHGEHVDRHSDRVDDRGDLLRRREPRRVDAVGAGVAVGDEPRDRVVEVVDAVEVVLRAARQHERRVERACRLRGLRDALGGERRRPRSAPRPGSSPRSSSLPRPPRRGAGRSRRRRPGRRGSSRSLSTLSGRSVAGGELPRRARRARRASPARRACRAPRRSPRSSSRAPRSRATRACARTRRPRVRHHEEPLLARGARGSAPDGRRPTTLTRSALPRGTRLGVDLVALDRRGDDGRLDRALVGERLQRGDRDVVAVDLEEAAGA